MSENQAEGTATAEKKGRGRPQETIDRDNQVFDVVQAAAAPLTRDQVAEAAVITGSQAYLSLWRLKRDKRIEKVRGAKYWPTGKELPPEPEPAKPAAEAADASAEQPAG